MRPNELIFAIFRQMDLPEEPPYVVNAMLESKWLDEHYLSDESEATDIMDDLGFSELTESTYSPNDPSENDTIAKIAANLFRAGLKHRLDFQQFIDPSIVLAPVSVVITKPEPTGPTEPPVPHKEYNPITDLEL